MSESLIAYLLHGVLKALDYLHRMGYVHRSVDQKHVVFVNVCKCLHVSVLSGQRGEGQSHPAVRGGPGLPVGPAQRLQHDA